MFPVFDSPALEASPASVDQQTPDPDRGPGREAGWPLSGAAPVESDVLTISMVLLVSSLVSYAASRLGFERSRSFI